jgi:hypothetical protein
MAETWTKAAESQEQLEIQKLVNLRRQKKSISQCYNFFNFKTFRMRT